MKTEEIKIRSVVWFITERAGGCFVANCASHNAIPCVAKSRENIMELIRRETSSIERGVITAEIGG